MTLAKQPPVLRVADIMAHFPVRRTVKELLFGGERRQLVALDGVSFEVHANESFGIVGESGSGKSTLAKVIVRLVEAKGGAVLFHGNDVLGMGREELTDARRRIQMIYQDPYASLNPRLSVERTIQEPARVHGLVARKESESLARELLQEVGLSDKLVRRRPRALSGGQRQRVAIARALATRPEILIADEATSALDVSIQAQILNLFIRLQHEHGLSMIFISHQLGVVSHVTNRVAVMYLGRIVETGPTADVFENPAHPYTIALLDAQPGWHRRAQSRTPALKGEIPSPLEIPHGCRFRTRCPLAQEICTEIDPFAVEVAPGHKAWCHVLPHERLAGRVGGQNTGRGRGPL